MMRSIEARNSLYSSVGFLCLKISLASSIYDCLTFLSPLEAPALVYRAEYCIRLLFLQLQLAIPLNSNSSVVNMNAPCYAHWKIWGRGGSNTTSLVQAWLQKDRRIRVYEVRLEDTHNTLLQTRSSYQGMVDVGSGTQHA
jgi:hypothetical protein